MQQHAKRAEQYECTQGSSHNVADLVRGLRSLFCPVRSRLLSGKSNPISADLKPGGSQAKFDFAFKDETGKRVHSVYDAVAKESKEKATDVRMVMMECVIRILTRAPLTP